MVIAVPVAALLLVAAGCGGGSTDSAGDTTATIPSVDTTAFTDTSGGMDTSSSTDTTTTIGDATLTGCTELSDLSVKFSEAMGAATSGSGTLDLEATAKLYEDFADQVPEEIRDAFKTFAAAFATYADVFKDIDLSSGKTPDPDTMAKIAEAAKGFDNAELTAATAEIEAWVKKNCTGG
jgi:hypothetical protein